MRAIDRVRAIQAIVSEMEGTMGFEDIRVFFEAMDIEPETDSNGDPIGGSKRDIIRSYIDTCPNTKLIDIAEQFGLGLNLASSSIAQLGKSKYWLADHLRVFISHVHHRSRVELPITRLWRGALAQRERPQESANAR